MPNCCADPKDHSETCPANLRRLPRGGVTPTECLKEITLSTDRHLDIVLAHKKHQRQRDACRAAELRDNKASSLMVDRRQSLDLHGKRGSRNGFNG